MREPEDNCLELATSSGHTIRVRKAMHPRAKRLRLTVTSQGARLSYPAGTRAVQMLAFLHQHVDWLETKLREMGSGKRHPPALKPGVPTLIPLRGTRTRLTWETAEFPQVQLLGDELRLSLPRPFSRGLPLARNLLLGFLETELRRDLARWLGGYVGELGRAPTGIKIKPLKSLWGSLGSHDHLTLDLALALAPRAALRYVFVHELCHLRVRNHSARFWNEVAKLMPDYQKQRDWLRINGTAIKLEIERLL